MGLCRGSVLGMSASARYTAAPKPVSPPGVEVAEHPGHHFSLGAAFTGPPTPVRAEHQGLQGPACGSCLVGSLPQSKSPAPAPCPLSGLGPSRSGPAWVPARVVWGDSDQGLCVQRAGVDRRPPSAPLLRDGVQGSGLHLGFGAGDLGGEGCAACSQQGAPETEAWRGSGCVSAGAGQLSPQRPQAATGRCHRTLPLTPALECSQQATFSCACAFLQRLPAAHVPRFSVSQSFPLTNPLGSAGPSQPTSASGLFPSRQKRRLPLRPPCSPCRCPLCPGWCPGIVLPAMLGPHPVQASSLQLAPHSGEDEPPHPM